MSMTISWTAMAKQSAWCSRTRHCLVAACRASFDFEGTTGATRLCGTKIINVMVIIMMVGVIIHLGSPKSWNSGKSALYIDTVAVCERLWSLFYVRMSDTARNGFLGCLPVNSLNISKEIRWDSKAGLTVLFRALTCCVHSDFHYSEHIITPV